MFICMNMNITLRGRMFAQSSVAGSVTLSWFRDNFGLAYIGLASEFFRFYLGLVRVGDLMFSGAI